MHKGDPCAVGPCSRRRPREAETRRRRTDDGGVDVGHSQSEVVQALAPAVEKPAERPVAGERLHELEFTVSHLHERHGGAFTGDRGTAPLNEAQGGERNHRLRIEVSDDDGQVRDARDGSHTAAEGR